MTATDQAALPVPVSESELCDWLIAALGPHVRDDYEAARLLLAAYDLAAKEGSSLNNPHQIANTIASSSSDNGPWAPVDTAQAAKLLHEQYRITHKPADHAQRMADLPMPVVVSRQQCPFCRRFTRADARQVQDHMTRCWQNPRLRCCKTCIHHLDGSHPEDDEGCTHADGPEPEGWWFPVLHCPLWQASP